MSHQQTPAQTTPAPQTTPAYEAPRVEELGAWQAITLIYSVPVNPTSGLSADGRNNGY